MHEHGRQGLLGGALVEREAVLRSVDELLSALAGGGGGVLVLEGAAGLGKTSLLAEACRRARAARLRVLQAQGGELEQDLPWGVCRDLLAREARRRSHVAAAAVAALGLGSAPPGEDLAALHALTELCGDLAEDGPLLLVVDDAQWSDRPSAAWLAHGALRLPALGVALVVAARPHDPRRPPELDSLGARDGVRVVALEPLTPAASAEVVRRALPGADDELRDACRRAAGGNPFLLTALLDELGDAEDVPAAAVEALAVDRVDRAVARRLAAAGPAAAALARAAALLGAQPDAVMAARLASLNDDDAAAAGDALRAAGLVAGEPGTLSFAHPLLRAAVERAVPAGERSRVHLRAARLLDAEGAAPERLGVHLLAVEPGSEPWVRERLLDAAAAATAAAAPRQAVTLLERALAERAGPPGRELLAALGRAALVVEPELAATYLRRALDATRDEEERVALALDLSTALQGSSRWTDAVAALEREAQGLAERGAPRELWLRVRTELLAQAFFDEEHRRRWRALLDETVAQLRGEGDAELGVVLQQAVAEVQTGTARRARELARRAWAGGRLLDADDRESPAVWWVSYVGMYAQDWPLADEAIARGFAAARRRGSLTATAYSSTQLAELRHRQGRLRESEALADGAWNVCAQLGPSFWCWWITLPARMQARLARGRPQEAWQVLGEVGLQEGELPLVMALPLLRATRAQVRIALGDAERGVAELRAAKAWAQERTRSPGGWLWPVDLVDGLLALGRGAEALAEAEAWLADTVEFGAPATIGMAQRAVGLSAGTDGLDLLEASVATLDGAGAQAELARSLVDLGAALRRAKRRSDAREPLRRGADLALRCGADGLAQRAAVELAATGSRPRTLLLDGVAALTPSELRIAQMAAEGLSNPEIAAALFVTRKTVEKHLSNTYLKLGVRSRDALPAALAAG